MHIDLLAQEIAQRRTARLLCLPILALLALLYAPWAALVLLIGCAQLLGDGIADWRRARRLPGGPAL
ncbi:MAG: hypothetical protein O3B21_14755 [Proteobacteria bacterium]|nr:hypothetical protein [Pseudomonadota bacterium]MDA1357773.1 hypothetical protein [Pseudomonadota bacterium]